MTSCDPSDECPNPNGCEYCAQFGCPRAHLEWRRHDGGQNPAPDRLVDLTWGYGIVERQPSSKVNWSFKWLWRLCE